MAENGEDDRLAAVRRPCRVRADPGAGAPVGQPERPKAEILLEFKRVLPARLRPLRVLAEQAWVDVSLLENAPGSIKAEALAKVAQPVALLWGTKDSFAGVNVGRSIADALPYGELHPLAGAGHLPWLEYPEKSGELILSFLAR
jgi:pimeloyl-ACP methyl ester carboxylesterase